MVQKLSVLFLLTVLSSCSQKINISSSGLQSQILQKGKGAKAQPGDEILLYETTTYRDGTILYTNESTGRPVKVLIGGNQATLAVDEGLRGMKVGEIKQIIAPPHLVKRKNYPPNVFPDSTLVIRLILDKIIEN